MHARRASRTLVVFERASRFSAFSSSAFQFDRRRYPHHWTPVWAIPTQTEKIFKFH